MEMSVAGPQSHDSPARHPGKGSPRTGNAPGAAAGGVFASWGETMFPPMRPSSAQSLPTTAGLRASESPSGPQADRRLSVLSDGLGGCRAWALAGALVRTHERVRDDRSDQRDSGG